MRTILYLTDLYFQAKGRKYEDEDLYITSVLKDHFHLIIGHPQQAITFLDAADIIVFRNTGPVIYYQQYFNAFVSEVKARGCTTFNSFDGKADMLGKGYLLQLFNEGYPVIPSVDKVSELSRLGDVPRYVVKLINGADSIGMDMMDRDEVVRLSPDGKLIQPYIDFDYEVSFYYLNDVFQYAMYAPDKSRRWELREYTPLMGDLDFAERFIRWNGMTRGITRVDACRLTDGRLLLVELEDLNPFLSIGLLPEQERRAFVDNFIQALKAIPIRSN